MPGTEESLASDILAGFTNEHLSDVTLVGSDGNRVSGVRFILAARSVVFERMLFGNFAEACNKEVSVGCTTPVLLSIIEFCCSDNIASFEGSIRNPSEQVARNAVQLFAAAHYFELPSLCNKTYTLACSLMDKHPTLACAIFDEAEDTDATKSMLAYALNTVRRKPLEALLSHNDSGHGGVSSLTAAKLGVLIGDEKMEADEFTIFKVLQKWVSIDVPCINGEDRVGIGKKFAMEIKLSHIEPSDLLGEVSASGLVEKNRITETVFGQAQQAQKKGYSFKKFRCVSPYCVLVQGAGVDEINGSYELHGELNGAPKYKRRGRWKGKDVFFFLYKYDENHWVISTPPAGEDTLDLSADVTDFYSYDETEGNDVPHDGWTKAEKGVKPAPRIFVH